MGGTPPVWLTGASRHLQIWIQTPVEIIEELQHRVGHRHLVGPSVSKNDAQAIPLRDVDAVNVVHTSMCVTDDGVQETSRVSHSANPTATQRSGHLVGRTSQLVEHGEGSDIDLGK